mgnify:CR=1 FL=1
MVDPTTPLLPPEQQMDAMMESSHAAEQVGMTPEEMARTFKEECEGHETEHAKILDKIRDFEKLWDGVPQEIPGADKDTYAILTATLDFMRNVETVHSNVWYSSFGAFPFFQCSSSTIEDERMQVSGDWQHALEHYLYEAKYKSVASVGLRALVQNGTEITGTFWKNSFRWNDMGKMWERVPFEDRPEFKPIDLFSFQFEPGSQDIEDAGWVNEEMWVSPSVCQKMIAEARLMPGAIVDEEAYKKGLALGKSKTEGFNTRQDQHKQYQGYESGGKSSKVHADVRYGFRPDDTDHPICWKYVTINRSQTFISHPNPFQKGFKPYMKATFIPVKGQFYGKGVGHMIGERIKEINVDTSLVRTRQRIDAMGMWQTEGATNPNEKIRPQPGGHYAKERFGTMLRLDSGVGDLAVQAQLIEQQKQDARHAVVANTTAQAEVTGATAKEVGEVASATVKRNQPVAEQVANDYTRPHLQRAMDLIAQFMPDEVVGYVLGHNGVRRAVALKKSMLPVQASVFVRVAPDLDMKINVARRITSFLSMVAGVVQSFPDVVLRGFTPDAFLLKGAESLDISPDEVFNPQLAIKRQAEALKMQIAKMRLEAQMVAAAQAPAAPGGESAPAAPPPPTGPEPETPAAAVAMAAGVPSGDMPQ